MKDLDVFVEIRICVLPSLQTALLVQCILIKRLRKQEEVKEWRNKEKKRIIKFWTKDLRIGEEEEMMPLIYGRRARKREQRGERDVKLIQKQHFTLSWSARARKRTTVRGEEGMKIGGAGLRGEREREREREHKNENANYLLALGFNLRKKRS
jgi:hypothetical protein